MATARCSASSSNQRGIDPAKQWSWPVYVTTLRARYKCPAVLLVFAPSPGVADWARQPIEIGHPGFGMVPVVIGFDEVPRVCDPIEASRLPELSVLSTMAHPEPEIATAAIEAICRLPLDEARLYLDFVMKQLPAPIRHLMEAQMKQRSIDDTPLGRSFAWGYKSGLRLGRKEGREIARQVAPALAELRAKEIEVIRQEIEATRRVERRAGLRTAAFELARRKLERISSDDLEAIDSVTDMTVLTELITSLGTAARGREARAAFRRVIGRKARKPRGRRSVLLGDAG